MSATLQILDGHDLGHAWHTPHASAVHDRVYRSDTSALSAASAVTLHVPPPRRARRPSPSAEVEQGHECERACTLQKAAEPLRRRVIRTPRPIEALKSIAGKQTGEPSSNPGRFTEAENELLRQRLVELVLPIASAFVFEMLLDPRQRQPVVTVDEAFRLRARIDAGEFDVEPGA